MFDRTHLTTLQSRLDELPRFIQVISGPRQIGKSTLVRSALINRHSSFVAADEAFSQEFDDFLAPTQSLQIPGVQPTEQWLIDQWLRARSKARTLPSGENYVLAIDEVQKIPRWSEVVKGLWDADRAENFPMHVVLLGSSPWLMQKGLTESLAGRFETIAMNHWSYPEMQEAFDFSIDEFIFFGGYPGAAQFIPQEARWRDYVKSGLIKPNIDVDILQMTRVDKPALLKQLFELGCGAYSGQQISLTKLLGQLQDAGNTVTLTHYLELLSQAGLLTGLPKYAGNEHRRRNSPPKFNAHNTALISAQANYTFEQAKSDRSYWGRLVESAIGAHLINDAPINTALSYWRESPFEVDFILTNGHELLAIEVKSASGYAQPEGLEQFVKKFPSAKKLIVGPGGLSIIEFLSTPVQKWLQK